MTAVARPRFRGINPSVLIEEIKKRPILYDMKIAHNNTELRKSKWEEVALAICEENWVKYSEQEREAIVREMQVKWKSLRDNFTRVLRKEKEEEMATGMVNQKRKKYIYYDQLMFLAPYCNSYYRKTGQNIIYLEENKDSDESIFTSEDTNQIQPLQFIQIQPNSSMSVSAIATSEPQTESDNTETNKRIANVLEQLVALQKEDRDDDDVMGNKKFLLSLLPYMKKLADDVNLEVRLQLMSVLQTYTSGKGFL